MAACLSGVSYATLNVTIRRLVTGSVQMPVVLATVSSMGVITLGLGSVARIGDHCGAPRQSIGQADTGARSLARNRDDRQHASVGKRRRGWMAVERRAQK